LLHSLYRMSLRNRLLMPDVFETYSALCPMIAPASFISQIALELDGCVRRSAKTTCMPAGKCDLLLHDRPNPAKRFGISYLDDRYTSDLHKTFLQDGWVTLFRRLRLRMTGHRRLDWACCKQRLSVVGLSGSGPLRS